MLLDYRSVCCLIIELVWLIMVCKLVDLLLFLFYMRAVIKFYAYASCYALRVSVGLIGVEILANFDATRNFPNKRCCVLLTLMFEVA